MLTVHTLLSLVVIRYKSNLDITKQSNGDWKNACMTGNIKVFACSCWCEVTGNFVTVSPQIWASCWLLTTIMSWVQQVCIIVQEGSSPSPAVVYVLDSWPPGHASHAQSCVPMSGACFTHAFIVSDSPWLNHTWYNEALNMALHLIFSLFKEKNVKSQQQINRPSCHWLYGDGPNKKLREQLTASDSFKHTSCSGS